ncbi:uncharacterized protein LOC143850593 [Tasmannia lanceolata]|uniref:uncharacterized protein LOC143850593 n=1 Tax=Tasmannia lanceolata TaxID=3420 RepID=UPI004062C7D5
MDSHSLFCGLFKNDTVDALPCFKGTYVEVYDLIKLFSKSIDPANSHFQTCRRNALIFGVLARHVIRGDSRAAPLALLGVVDQINKGRNPVPIMLAETFFGPDRIDHQKVQNSFYGCAKLLYLSAMKDDIALLKNDRLSTSKDPANQQSPVIPSVPLVSPRPAVLPEIEDFDECQYAAESCLPNLGNPDKAQELADQIEKLTRDMETMKCMALRHRIQDKIEAKEIAVEALPNVTRNPLPTHAMPPPNVYAILTEEVVLDHSRICAVISDEPFEGEEEKGEVPYVLKLEDDDLLLLNDPCDEVRHVTRGGRVFKPPELRAENPAEIARAVENQNQRLRPEEDEDVLLKQLRKTQANVSIWGLLMSSPKHRQVILRELNTAQVSVNITPDELVGLVSMARAAMTVSFSDEDLTPEGKNHTKSLRVTVVCNKKKVPEVLVDNGSALNVCPLSTATALGFGPNDYIPSEQGILAYDGTRRDVIGTLVTEIKIGGEMFDIEFQVLDIKTSFFLLLGRPWLHKVGVVPSTVHQKLKFIKNNRIITVRGDPEPEVGQISEEQIGSSTIDVSLTGFSLEVSTITMEEAMSEEILFMSSANAQVARIMRKYGYIPGTGLGRNLQGLTE